MFEVQMSVQGRMSLGVLVLAATLAIGQGSQAADTGRPRSAQRNPAAPAAPPPELVVEHIRGNFYLIGGAGGNITVQVGNEGVLLVDSGVAAMSEQVLAAIRKITPAPVSLIVNTHYDLDHTGGNAAISATGRYVSGGARTVLNRAGIWAHEKVQARVSRTEGTRAALLPQEGWPIETYFVPVQELYFNGEPIQLLHQPNAHTDGDSVVFFRRSDVIATGDVFNTTVYPRIDAQAGGHVNGIIAALNRIIDLAIPEMNQEGGTLVVPGHGHISDEYDVVIYRDMVTVVRDRILDLIKKGMTLEQVQAAKPTFDYDGVYGATTGSWTTTQFVEAVYRNLKEQP